jgi:hypothetical protein
MRAGEGDRFLHSFTSFTSRFERPAALGALATHWPEYLMEAAGLGLFMISACAFTVLLFHPESPTVRALPDGDLRRC